MLEHKLAIYHRAESLSSQACSVDLCSIDCRIIDQASVQTASQQWMTKPLSVSMHTNRILNSAILSNKYFHANEAIVSDRFEASPVKK